MQNPGAYNRAFRINARVSSCHTLRPSSLSKELATLLDVCKSVSSSSVANVAFRPVPCIFLLHKWLRFIATNYTTHALHARFSVVVINRRRHCYDCNTLHYRDTQAWMLFLSSALLDMDSQVICTLDNFKAMPTNVVMLVSITEFTSSMEHWGASKRF